ncbi:radical SAM protein [Streptomyces sp. ET3-23]|uniref:radical SAM/SPASM domain-containing protein n=1 Tax=Streptomyces sp. ET3-23 TaxID=2885643 RepID=UPI001D0FE50C|nr:radical SAM protein [Streptomyces sp. ET3-23]MCC2278682.1 radical SAM protein [Streptomyces sp. ET3-23]
MPAKDTERTDPVSPLPQERVSDYVRVSDRAYLHAGHQRVCMVYATRTGSMVAVPEEDGRRLARGTLEGIGPELLDGLREIEAVVPVVTGGQGELDTVLDRQRAASADLGSPRYVLLPTTYCNMGCSYCGQQHTRGRLSGRHRDAVARRVLAGIERKTTRTVTVSWFGAEPMIGYPMILDLSARFTAAAQDRGVGYVSRMVTNGTLLTPEKLRVLRQECHVTRYDITLDGPARIHDAHRPLRNGRRSFDRITRLLLEALQDDALADVGFVLRTNIDVANADWVTEYLDTMAELGFADGRVFFNLAPVYSWGNDVSRIELDRRHYAQREVEWMRHMHELGLHFVALPTEPEHVLCAAVSQSVEIHSSSGAMFSCSEYPLVPQQEATGGLGSIETIPVHAIRPLGPFDDWHDAVAAGETPCHTCYFFPVCGGACPKQWREGNTPCPPYKFTLQERFDLVAEMNGLTPAPC